MLLVTAQVISPMAEITNNFRSPVNGLAGDQSALTVQTRKETTIVAEQDRVKIYNLGESYGGGGGGAFPNGRYRIEEASFVMFDFNGKAKKPAACLCCSLQPLDEDNNEAGDIKVQYWSIGDDVKPVDKGKAIILTGTHDKIWNMSDFYQFMQYLGKAGIDMDAIEEENDISLIAGKVGDFGKVLSLGKQPDNVGQVVDGKKVYPKETIVMTKLYEEAKKGKEIGRAHV